MTREELRDRVCVMMGGRAAEMLLCGDVSTGAQNDLEQATAVAEQMVRRFGMSDRLGPRTLTGGLSSGGPFGDTVAYSEVTQRAIDDEISVVLDTAMHRAREIVAARRVEVERVAERLLVEETMERGELEALTRRPAATTQTAAE